MSKSVYVVGGIGAAGCVLMSFMMQHLLKVRTEQTRSPVAIELEQTLAQHLAGPIEVATLDSDGERTMRIRLAAKPRVDAAQLARSAGDLIWHRAYKWTDMPDLLQVEVRSTEPARPSIVVASRPPGLDGLRLPRPPKASSPSAPSRPPNPPNPPK